MEKKENQQPVLTEKTYKWDMKKLKSLAQKVYNDEKEVKKEIKNQCQHQIAY